MSLEAVAVILALLWGPTALWLIFRAVRGPTGGTRESFAREPARPRTEQLPLEAVIRNEYWICKHCRSVNHLGAMHCYSCGIERPRAQPVAPEPTPTGNGWVPVMDPAVGRRTTEPVTVTRLQPTSSALPPDPPVAAPMPELAPEDAMVAAGVAAASRATKRPRTPRRSHAPAGGATAAELSVAAHMTAAPPTATAPAAIAPEPAPEPATVAAGATAASRAPKRPRTTKRPHAPAGGSTAAELSVAADVTAAPPATSAPAASAPAAAEPAPPPPQTTPSIAPPVCPYLGFKDDPATLCSYPDSRNVCHAAANGGPSMPTARRLVRGVRGGRTLAISAEHQAKLCLTNEHRQCDRYPAAHSRAEPKKEH